MRAACRCEAVYQASNPLQSPFIFFLCKSQIYGMSLSINPAALSKNSRLQLTNQNNIDRHKKGFHEADGGNMVLTATGHNDSVSFLSRTPSSC